MDLLALLLIFNCLTLILDGHSYDVSGLLPSSHFHYLLSAQGYSYAGQDRIQQQQAEVNEVVGIMKDNVARVLERDQRLSDLDHRADELQVHSREFESISRNIQRKYFWRNMKMWGIIVGVVVVLIIVIIIWATADRS